MRIEYHRTLLADRVRNAAFHAALQARHRQGPRPRWPTSAPAPASSASWPPSSARPRVDLYEAAEIAGVARKLLRHNRLPNCRIAEVHSTEVAEPDRVDVVVSRDARQLSLRGEHHRHAQRRARALPEARRHRSSRTASSSSSARRRRALLPRARPLGRGRLRPRLRAGQGHEPQQHLRALVRAGRPARRRRRGQGLGQGRPSTAATRPRARARRPGASSGPSRSTVWRCGGRRSWSPASRFPPARSTRARTGSSSTCPRCRRSQVAAGQTLTARLRSTTSYERGTNVTWTLAVSDASGREVARQALDLEKGYPALRRIALSRGCACTASISTRDVASAASPCRPPSGRAGRARRARRRTGPSSR